MAKDTKTENEGIVELAHVRGGAQLAVQSIEPSMLAVVTGGMFPNAAQESRQIQEILFKNGRRILSPPDRLG